MTTTKFYAQSENGRKLEIIITSSENGISVEIEDETILTLGYETSRSENLCLSIHQKQITNCDFILV